MTTVIDAHDDEELQDSTWNRSPDSTDDDVTDEEADYEVDLVAQRMIRQVKIPGDMDKLQYVGTLRLAGRSRDRKGGDLLIYGRTMKGGYEQQVCSVNQNMEMNPMQNILQNDSGAHNLFFIDDDITHEYLAGLVGGNYQCTAFAIGGQYRSPLLPNGFRGYDGIYLFGIMASGSYPYDFQAQRCRFLVDGRHAGVID